MAAKKIFPPGEVEKLLGRHVDNPFGDDYDEFKLGISFRILAGQILMQFSDHVERIRMTASGARKLAAMLNEKASELDCIGNVREQEGGNSATPPKRSSRRAVAKPAE